MNRIDKLFQTKQRGLRVFYTVLGYPNSSSTVGVLQALAKGGADIIEIGMPFSDPVADGPVIQQAHGQALKNGVTMKELFRSSATFRRDNETPLIAMGYLNTVLSFGVEAFLEDCTKNGIDGVILPDMLPEEFERSYQNLFETKHIHPIFLVSPNTPDDRIRYIDSLSRGFVYAVSSLSITGNTGTNNEHKWNYLNRLSALKLQNPILVGFGIKSKGDLQLVDEFTAGGIIGSALIELLAKNSDEDLVTNFVKSFS